MSINSKKKSYLPSIDGLRALAIIFVLAYHFQLPFFQGGFIGVDIFFVLSGYLITSTLLREWVKNKKFDVKSFWLKRLRRLLPAVVLLLVVVLLVCFFLFPASFKKSWPDSIAAMFYVSNWWYIFQKIPYFDSFGTPSPFKHLWSLAIEEQFYLLWPLALLGLLKLLKKRQHVLKFILALGAASALLMAFLYTPETIDRVYYGTDTRLFGILAGCALAFVWPYYYLEDNLKERTRQIFDGAGLAALTGIFILGITLNEYQDFLYHGGFVLVSLLTVIVLAVIIHPSSQLGRYLGNDYLNWIGKRSYSIYLWHYPVIALTTPVKIVGTIHLGLIILQLALSLVLANASYLWVEEPIRRFGIKETIHKLVRLPRTRFRLPIYSIGAILVLSLSLWGLTGYLTNVTLQSVKKIPNTSQSPKEQVKDKTPKKTVKKQIITKALGIGDSIILGVEDELKKELPTIQIDGKVGRQLVDAKELVEEKYLEYNSKEALIIIELGSNSPFKESDLTDFIALFDQANLLIVNTRVPRNWEKEVNSLLDSAVNDHKNAVLVDWYDRAIGDPGLLADDGVHLSEAGVAAYIQLIMEKTENFELKLAKDEK